jgi:CspA family cold shock protein
MSCSSHGRCTDMSDKVLTGTVSWWSDQKGYGFIVRDDNSKPDVFVHFRGVKDQQQLVIGERVSFVIGTDPQSGRIRAEQVEILKTTMVLVDLHGNPAPVGRYTTMDGDQ